MAQRRDEVVSLNVNPFDKPHVKSRSYPKRRRCLDLNVKMLFYFGVWKAEGYERRGMLFYWRYFCPRIQLVRMTYSIIFQAINISLVWGNLSFMSEYAIMLAIYSMGLVKCITVFLYQAKLREMVRTLEILCSPRHSFNKDLKIKMNKTDRSAEKITKYCFISGAVLVLTLGLGVVIQGFIKRSIPFKRWFPYDAYSSPVFEITLIANSVLVAIDFGMIVMVDLLFITLTMHIVSQFEILKHKLSHTRVNVETITKKKAHLTSLYECLRPTKRRLSVATEAFGRHLSDQSAARRDMGASSEERRRVTGQVRLYSRTDRKILRVGTLSKLEPDKLAGRERSGNLSDEISEMAMQTNNIETILQMECYLNQCAKDHQQLIWLCSQLGKVFKLMLYFQVFSNIVCGLFVLYITTLARHVDVKVIIVLATICVCYFQYFLFCWYGNRITEESVNVRDAIYDCDWFGASESFKRSMRIMILRTNRPIIIRAGGLPLSMRTFKSIYKAAYYLNMILSKLFHGEQIIKPKM